jgi:hypothetical protein
VRPKCERNIVFAEQIEQPRLQPEFIPDFDYELVAADFRQLQKECFQTGDELRVIVEGQLRL